MTTHAGLHPEPEPEGYDNKVKQYEQMKDESIKIAQQKATELKEAANKGIQNIQESSIGQTVEQTLETGITFAKQHRTLLLQVLPVACIFFILAAISIDVLENPGSVYNQYSFLPGAEKRREAYNNLLQTYENQKNAAADRVNENMQNVGNNWQRTKDRVSPTTNQASNQGRQGYDYSKGQSASILNNLYGKTKDAKDSSANTINNMYDRSAKTAKDAKDSTNNVLNWQNAKDTVGNVQKKSKEGVEYSKDQTTNTFNNIYEKSKDAFKTASDKVGESLEDARQWTGRFGENIRDSFGNLQDQTQETAFTASAKWRDYMNYINHQVGQASRKMRFAYAPTKAIGLTLFYLTFALYPPGTSTNRLVNVGQLAGLGLATLDSAYNALRLNYHWPSMTLLSIFLVMLNASLLYLNWDEFTVSLRYVEREARKKKEEALRKKQELNKEFNQKRDEALRKKDELSQEFNKKKYK